MKKALLAANLVVSAAAANGQCTPNQLYADSIYGVWPDTTENFASGVLNSFYSDTLNIQQREGGAFAIMSVGQHELFARDEKTGAESRTWISVKPL